MYGINTHVISFSSLWRPQDLCYDSQSCEAVMDARHPWVFVRTKRTLTSAWRPPRNANMGQEEVKEGPTHCSSRDFFRYALVISDVEAEGATPTCE